MSYVSPTLTIDFALFSFDEDFDLNVLLIERKNEPFASVLALPGGYVNQGETTYQALNKKIKTKTNIDIEALKYIEQLYTFDSVGRDPRGHAVSVCWYGLCQQDAVASLQGENPRWIKIKDIKDLAFDHGEVINFALARLKDKIWYSNIVFAITPPKFKLEDLIIMYKNIDEGAEEDVELYLMNNNVLKMNQDETYSVKINQLTYYKK